MIPLNITHQPMNAAIVLQDPQRLEDRLPVS